VNTQSIQLNYAFVWRRVPNSQQQTISEFQTFAKSAMASKLLAPEFRHYGIAAAALHFRDIGEHKLALDTFANPDYRPDFEGMDDWHRKDFLNDLRLIAKDAGCLDAAQISKEWACQQAQPLRCELAAKRACEVMTAGPQ
jgi:hypothetical protein